MDIQIHITATSIVDLHNQLKDALAGCALFYAQPVASGETAIAVTVSPCQPAAPEAPAEEPIAEPVEPTQAVRQPGQPSPGKTRRTKAEIAEDETLANASTVEPAPTATAPTPEPVVAIPAGMQTVASWEESGVKFELTRDEVIDAARAFIAGHREGKDRGNAVIKGICAAMGFARVSEVPDDRLQELLDMMGEAK